MRDAQDMILRTPQRPLSSYINTAAANLPSETPEPPLVWPILRQWWIVLLFSLIGVAAAMAYISHAQNLYTSFAKMYIQPAPSAVVEVLGANERNNYLATQVEIIRSTTILQKAVDNTPGMRMKTFIPAAGNPVLFLREEMEVKLEQRTDLIMVSLSSPWPDEAAAIVEAVVNAYKSHIEEERGDLSKKTLDALEKTKQDQDAEIQKLNDQITVLWTENPTISRSPDPNSRDAQALTLYDTRLITVNMQLIDALTTYGPEHRLVKNLRDQIAALEVAQKKVFQELQANNQKSVQLAAMQSLLDSKRDFTRRLADRIQQQQMATQGQKLATIDIVEPPHVADYPSYPRRNRTMAVAIAAGMLVGAGLALLRDRLDGRMRSVEEIQTVVGLPILGVVPVMTGRRTAIARAMAVHLDPRSPVAEAYRTIRTAVYFGANGSSCKTLLITSPEPGDGKTTSASNLAIAIAQTGRSVLLLDADFRKPTQHKNLDVKDAIGLSSVLAGREPLERAIQRTGVEGLDILPCGAIPANPSEILNSREFGELVDTLAVRYDHIIFDSPPVNAVTDARILGAVCDATILVLRADKSTRKAAEHARNVLLAVGARVLGAVVNDAPKRKGYESYGGSYYGPVEAVPVSRRLIASPHDPDNLLA